ncbi:MAG TPA: VCBS repeat-containing protein, partial [Gemmataceae bacterium]
MECLEDRTVLSFFGPPTFAVVNSPVAQAVGDFNGDGRSDLVLVNQGANTVSVLLGNGNGTFQAKTDYATGTSPAGVAVGDFNGDGKADLAVVNSGANSISVLAGNGDGTFQPKTDIALTLTPKALTTGDFNGDGNTDIAVATGNSTTDDVTMLLGNGNGTFQLPVTTVTDTAPVTAPFYAGRRSSISSADFNGDGHLDLVVVNNKDTNVIGKGGVVIGEQSLSGTVSVLLGNGDSTFQAPRNFALGSDPTSVAVGDFNGDGRPDFAVSNTASGSVSAFMNSGNANFSSSTMFLGTTTGILAAGDFNGDSVTDLAVPSTILSSTSGFSAVKLFNGQTGIGLQAGATYVPALSLPVAGDFNGDGHLDLAGIVSTGIDSSAIEPWLNNGNGTFPAPSLISAAGVALSSQATADFNGDGIPDLVTSSGQVQLGLGDGRFGDTTTLAFLFGSSVAAVDADGNGTVDILVGNPAYPNGQVAAWLNSPGFDNRTGGAVGFTISAPTQVTAGANTSVTVTAVDALGNPVPGFLGTVDLDSTPAGSTARNLLSQYTFTAADNGRHTFLISNLTQA